MLDKAQARDAMAAPSSPISENETTTEEAMAAATAAAAPKAEDAVGSRRRSDSLPPGAGAVRKKQKMYLSIIDPAAKKLGDDAVKLNFAQRLMELLEMEDVKPYMHWSEDGLKICIEDHVRFADEMLPKYFSDTKYKSFMVRIKRWGFNVVPSHGNPKSSQLILECANFRRDKPELCLLMGDKRRNERTKTSNSKKQVDTSTDGNPPPVTKEPAANGGVASATVTTPLPESEALFSSELAKLQYQRRLQDLQFNLHARHGVPISPTRGLLGGGYGGLRASSLYGLGDNMAALQGEGGLAASLSLYSIEREIQDCLHNIAAQQDRLVILQSMKELKVHRGTFRSSDIGLGAGLGSSLQSGP